MQKSLIAIAVLLLAACSTTPSLPEGRCRAAGAKAQLGKHLDDRVTSDALRESGALRSRVLPYRSPVNTGEADPMRLNIEVDGKGTIQRMQCG